jgi:hypothetical protein
LKEYGHSQLAEHNNNNTHTNIDGWQFSSSSNGTFNQTTFNFQDSASGFNQPEHGAQLPFESTQTGTPDPRASDSSSDGVVLPPDTPPTDNSPSPDASSSREDDEMRGDVSGTFCGDTYRHTGE